MGPLFNLAGLTFNNLEGGEAWTEPNIDDFGGPCHSVAKICLSNYSVGKFIL